MSKPKAPNSNDAELSNEEYAEIVKGYLYPDASSDNEDEDADEEGEVDPEDETDLPEGWDPDAWDQEDPNDD